MKKKSPRLQISKIPHRRSGEGIVIQVKVEPRASRTEITGLHGDALKIRLTSPPVEGKANRQLIEVLAREFGLKKGQIEVIGGSTSKMKTVLLRDLRDD